MDETQVLRQPTDAETLQAVALLVDDALRCLAARPAGARPISQGEVQQAVILLGRVRALVALMRRAR